MQYGFYGFRQILLYNYYKIMILLIQKKGENSLQIMNSLCGLKQEQILESEKDISFP